MHIRSLLPALAIAAAASACSPGNVFSLSVGDCFQDDDQVEVTDVEVVDCDDPHDNEVFHAFELPDGDFPGDAAVQEAAADACLGDAFERYIGQPYPTSEVEAFPITPTQASWEQGDDREVLCAAYVGSERLTGSLEGSGR